MAYDFEEMRREIEDKYRRFREARAFTTAHFNCAAPLFIAAGSATAVAGFACPHNFLRNAFSAVTVNYAGQNNAEIDKLTPMLTPEHVAALHDQSGVIQAYSLARAVDCAEEHTMHTAFESRAISYCANSHLYDVGSDGLMLAGLAAIVVGFMNRRQWKQYADETSKIRCDGEVRHYCPN